MRISENCQNLTLASRFTSPVDIHLALIILSLHLHFFPKPLQHPACTFAPPLITAPRDAQPTPEIDQPLTFLTPLLL
ncbi:hypothetical protein AMTR_s00011p00266900, partial [Amborella trichopoda]